jgi:hypothetical protein
MCFSSQMTVGIPSCQVGEGFSRVLQETCFIRCAGGRHGRRQVDQPLRVREKAVHYFQRSDGVLFADGDIVMKTSADDPLAKDILHIQEIILHVLGA